MTTGLGCTLPEKWLIVNHLSLAILAADILEVSCDLVLYILVLMTFRASDSRTTGSAWLLHLTEVLT